MLQDTDKNSQIISSEARIIQLIKYKKIDFQKQTGIQDESDSVSNKRFRGLIGRTKTKKNRRGRRSRIQNSKSRNQVSRTKKTEFQNQTIRQVSNRQVSDHTA